MASGCGRARPWAGACDRVTLPPAGSLVPPAAGPTCASDHGDEGLGQRGADSLPSPQPGQNPGHGAELCTGYPPQPFAHQQVKPEGWGAVPSLDVLPVLDMCQSEHSDISEHFGLAHSLSPPGKIQPRGAGWEGGNSSEYFKSCKATDQTSLLPRILNKTISTKKKRLVNQASALVI